MRPGDVVGGRFELLERARAGSSGEVFRARDRVVQAIVACKLLAPQDDEARARFEREASVLASLDHPGIVRHIAHGIDRDRHAEGRPYLILTWLEGEALDDALERGPLPVASAIEVARQVASALGAVHRQGLVHGDVAPANLMLADGSLDRVVLIDFGAAWSPSHDQPEERWGTPGYTAPEQASGRRDVDARADVFSLGCVLYRCLTGRGPFVGPSLAAVLAKVLLSPSPPASTLAAEVPPALDALLDRLLAKDPAQRPADGDAVATELAAMAAGLAAAPPRRAALTRREARSLTLLLVASREEDEAAMRAATGASRVHRLPDGAWLAVFEGRAAAAAERAAKAALALRERGGVVVATGRSHPHREVPVSDAIDRAAAMLRAAAAPGAPGPLLDEATVGLLAGRFAMEEAPFGVGWWLGGEQAGVGSLLGRPSPFVGRERERRVLDEALARAVSGEGPRAVLVLGEAGAGKTRLAQQWLAGLGRDAMLWTARGDALTAGSPFGLLGQVLRQAFGLQDGDPLEVRQRLLQERVRQVVEPTQASRVAEFLGALAGVPFAGSVQLRAAREDALLKGDQMRRAWEDWLGAECARRPVVLLIDDLQWGDLPSVRYLDATLRALAGKPLLVLALADPEVDLLFPRLWAERGVERVELGPLSTADSLQIARQVLGGRVDEDTLRDAVERAGGHPFFLEELLRARARGASGQDPATALAVLETRFEGLSSEGRRALRAASCFGRVFWRGGVAELLGADPGEALDELIEEEFIEARESSRFVGEREYAFRQALGRGAAYATLTAEDLCLGHALARHWLERQGERDPAVLAEHCERGGEPARAVGFFRVAAEQALEGNDFVGAVAHAERGLRAGARGALAGELRRLQAEALHWRGDLESAERCASEALDQLAAGSADWFLAAGLLASISARLDHLPRLIELSQRLHRSPAHPPLNARNIALAQTALQLLFAGQPRLATELLDDLPHDAGSEPNPSVAAWICRARAQLATAQGDPGGGLRWTDEAATFHRLAGDLRNLCSQLANAGSARNELGRYHEAEALLRESAQMAERIGSRPGLAAASLNLGMTLAHLGKLDEAIATETLAAESFEAMGHRRLALGARAYQARILLMRGDAAGAARLAQPASDRLGQSPSEQVVALTALSMARLALGDPTAALAASRSATALLATLGHVDEGEAALRSAHAEALLALGLHQQARDTLREARIWLESSARSLHDESLRHSFLHHAADNARLLALAERHAG